MHFTDVGAVALLLALIFALYAVASSLLGARQERAALAESGRRAALLVAGMLALASAALILSFLTRDFGAAYVAEHSSLAMPWYYTAAAFYGGQEGSLLYWSLALGLFAALAVIVHRRAPAGLMPYVVAVLMSIEAFFLLLLNFISTPFARQAIVPQDGAGLNPLLQDPGMLIHPPMLLMGYMSFGVPFAFAVAAMITGRLDGSWVRAIRRWMLASWTIQSAGLLLGMWWAYHVLGWGGYWGWDPVENAALLPWLTATAFLHSAMVQERRGALKTWNLGLVIATFGLSIFGTFEVRSGIINSVHSFAYSAIGPFFLGFLGVIVVASLALFFYRLPRLKPEQELDTVVSREGGFLGNNLLLSGIAFATFWGTIFPLISEALRGQQMTVGTSFYQQVNGPLFAVLILLMGVGPLLAWRRASWRGLLRSVRVPAVAAALVAIALPLLGVRNPIADLGFALCVFVAVAIGYEVYRGVRVRHGHGEGYLTAFANLVERHRLRYGGYLVHLGVVVLAVGIIASLAFQAHGSAELARGSSLNVSGYTITYKNITDRVTSGGIEEVDTTFTVSQHGHVLATVVPGQRIFPGFPNEPASKIAISEMGLSDFYVFLAAYNGTQTATIQVFMNPMVTFVWYGGLLMLLGGICCWLPERRRTTRLAERAAPERVEVMA